MGRCNRLDSPKSFLWYAPQLCGASFLCFHTLCFLSSGLTGRELATVETAGILLPEFPQGSLAHIGGLQSTDDSDILVYWYPRKYSISQCLKRKSLAINFWYSLKRKKFNQEIQRRNPFQPLKDRALDQAGHPGPGTDNDHKGDAHPHNFRNLWIERVMWIVFSPHKERISRTQSPWGQG